MKTKSKRRWFALFMVFVMLIGTTPMTAFAEDHRPTEECNAKTGDLLCTIPETERHVHSTECVCPGGESICGLEETEGHTHGESCYDHIENREIATSPDASKKNLICHLDDQEGHTHTEACICPGGELNCGFKETEESKKDSTVLDKGAFDEDRAFTSDIETATPSEALKAPMPMLTAADEVMTPAEFVAAVKAGGEVKLGADITVDHAADAGNKTIPLANNVTIDCNGFTLSGTGRGSLLQVNEGVTLTLANAQLNIENGFVATNDGVVTVESTGTEGVKAAWLVNTNNGTLTVKDGTFNVRGVVFSSSGTVDIQGGTFTATGYNNTCFGKIKGTMTLKNAKVTATYSCVTMTAATSPSRTPRWYPKNTAWKGEVEESPSSEGASKLIAPAFMSTGPKQSLLSKTPSFHPMMAAALKPIIRVRSRSRTSLHQPKKAHASVQVVEVR